MKERNKFDPNWIFAVIRCDKKSTDKESNLYFKSFEVFILKVIWAITSQNFNEILQNEKLKQTSERWIRSKLNIDNLL